MPSFRSHAIIGALSLLALSSAAFADTNVTPATEYRDRIKVARTIQPSGDTPFGENVNLYKGGLSFTQTDISFPGIGPTITLSRSYEVGGGVARSYISSEMADWSLSVPRIKTIVPGDRNGQVGKWRVGTMNSPSDLRCAEFSKVSVNPYSPLGQLWWNGYELRTPDGGRQPLLKRVPENTIAPGAGSYNIVTAGNWMIRCTSPLANSEPGDGFIALAPDGTEYRFDYLVYGPPVETLYLEMDGATAYLPRKEAYLYVTEIKDRFGNTLTYHYSGSHLTSITASDLREVSIAWSGNRVASITIQPNTAQSQTWTYEYQYGPLSRVVLPHAANDPAPPAWTFAMNNVNALEPAEGDGLEECGYRNTVAWQRVFGSGSFQATATITHPSGLTGSFDIAQLALTRASVPTSCGSGSPSYEVIPTFFIAQGLVEKRFSGPGVTAQAWKYRYAPGQQSSASECPASTCATRSMVEVTAPDDSTTRFEFRSVWDAQEGKLLKVISGLSNPAQANPVGLRTDTYTYASASQGPYLFPSRVGDNLDSAAGLVNEGPIELLSPQVSATVVQQAVTFQRTNSNFDMYGNPQTIVRASTGGSSGNFSKTEAITYSHNATNWVLSQPAIVSVEGIEVSKTIYDATTALPISRSSFGLVQQILAYNPDGTLASVTDAGGHATTLSQWYRGVPQAIGFPTNVGIAATVDSAGKLLSTTDELNSSTGYGYDAAGRLSAITYPTGDPVAWNGLLRSFAPVAVDEYGIPAPHWKETVQTGNGKTSTFYDARWQPVLTLTEDTAQSGSKSFVVRRFDGLGRMVFASYPVGSANINDTLAGVTTTYDALGRPLQTKQDSERGVLTTSTEYLSGFQTRVTNPRLFATTTSYQVFDAPSTDAPVLIQAPQGVVTTINRDVFGAPLSITRSGPGN